MTDAPAAALPDGLVTPVQERLLRVIYGPEAGAAERFRVWQEGLDLTDLDDGCYRLYPQLYRRIRHLAPDHAFLGRMKGTFRRTFYRNQLLFRWALDVVDRLAAAGIDCLVLKGASLVTATGLSAGLRPMADVDLLVPTRDAERAIAVADPRFRVLLDDPDRTVAHVLLRHGYTVRDANRLEIDLHWRLAGVWASGADPDRPFWDEAETAVLQGRTIRVLAPTDLLFHLVVHGLPRNPAPAIRWIADSLELLTTEGRRIDWGRLVALARRFRRSLLLARGLGYLRAIFDAAVPAGVVAELAAAGAADAVEQAEFDVLTRGWTPPAHLAAAETLTAAMLPILAERLPGHGLVAHLTDASLRPSVLGWLRRLGADFVCEFRPESPITEAVRRQLGSLDTGTDGTTRLFRFDVPEGALPVRHVYADLRRLADGRPGLRVFCTSLRAWPRGAVVLRLDRADRLLRPNLVGARATMPTSALPIWPGFFAAGAFRAG
ncbi:nucleotidyltransferase family protein [Stella sp.]|uniref:nucleotidyltransferase domain-containing protein n=1 Tax=Stella sp. TaxID=2912054 RepID=UPI0035B4D72D